MSTPGVPHDLSRWAHNADVALHYLDSHPGEGLHAHPGEGLHTHPGEGLDARPGADVRAPLVFVPGFGEEALDHVDFLAELAPRRVIVADLRGRGPSGAATADDWQLGPHVTDLDAIVTASGAARVHVATYSRGTAYGLRWALDNLDRVASITVGDYPAAQIAPPVEVIPMLQEKERFGRPNTDRIPAEYIARIIEQAHTEWYWDDLAAADVPFMLIHGTRRSAMAKDEVLAQYKAARPDARYEAIDTGHDLWKPDPAAVPRLLAEFLDSIDG